MCYRQYVVSHCTSRFLVFACCGQAASSPPPVNPNGKRSLVAQAFAVVIIGLCKFNIKWVFISIVKIWSKIYTSRRSTSISVLLKNGICSTSWQFFLEKCLCRQIDDQKPFAFIMHYVY
jgi:hypothetical protein